ncbi:MAG: Hsp20/alpha crystallin family protein [Thermoplasmatota archaeon]
MEAASSFDLAPTDKPNEWAATVHIPGYPDGALTAVAELRGRGVLGIADRSGRIVDRVVVPGGVNPATLRATYRNGVLDATFETLRHMPGPES